MVGRLRRNFRFGNIAEDVGISLLKCVAAVAEVSRTEDVGVDVVGNLLREDVDANLYAEDGFVVQLKSASRQSIKYQDSQLDWFRNQELPMFFGSVSEDLRTLTLFSGLKATQVALTNDLKQLELRFGNSDSEHFDIDCAERSGSIDLGSPVLRWTLADMRDPAWRLGTYTILKKFLNVARHLTLRARFGEFVSARWETGCLESIIVSEASSVSDDRLKEAATAMEPILKAMMLNTAMQECLGRSGHQIRESIFQLVNALRDAGSDIDENERLRAFFNLTRHGLPICQREAGDQPDIGH